MAHGMSDWIPAFFLGSVPKMCGKVEEKDVAAWMAVKWIFPMLSLLIKPDQ